MKIELNFYGGTYSYRSYNGKDGNINIPLDGEKYIKTENKELYLIDSILRAFGDFNGSKNKLEDIDEMEFNIGNNGGNLNLGSYSEEIKARIYINFINRNQALLTVNNQKLDFLHISNGNINGIMINNTNIGDLKIDRAELTGFMIIRNDSNIKNLIFEACSMSEELGMDSKLEFDNSKIGLLILNRTTFPIIVSNDTVINGIFPYKISFPKIEVKGKNGFLNILEEFESSKNTPSETKDYYRQLKHSHDEIGNKTEANKFFAKEMEYYEKSLTWSDWDKKLVSFLQRYSNNYGNSWLKPFLWIIFISFIYTLIFNCWNFQCSCGGSWSWECFQSYWLKNVSQFPTELKNAKDWWFLLYAVIMGTLIYQLLVALRRISQR